MPLIDRTYFVGELDIPRTGNVDVNARLNWFIAKYEKRFLKHLLGDALYADYIVGTTVVEGYALDQKWLNLQALLPNMIACYVYVKWLYDAAQQNTSLGVTEAKAENAKVVSSTPKIFRRWQEMREEIASLDAFFEMNITTYSNWVLRDKQKADLEFGFINPVF